MCLISRSRLNTRTEAIQTLPVPVGSYLPHLGLFKYIRMKISMLNAERITNSPFFDNSVIDEEVGKHYLEIRQHISNYLQVVLSTVLSLAPAREVYRMPVVIRSGSISHLLISIRYRYFRPKISAISISISFTAALFGLLTYFIIASKVVNEVNFIP